MKNIKILDCTLRDGGYCNEWEFGKKNIQKIIDGLEEARIDFVEIGLLDNSVIRNENSSKKKDINDFNEFSKGQNNLICLYNYGEVNVEDIPDRKDTSISGIRIAFHKKNWEEALEECYALKEKGYKVFVQPMVTVRYSDVEFLEMIDKVNKIQPYAFYIVDSFGNIKKNELLHLFFMSNRNLKEGICIGFHSHNNMQLAYANAQAIIAAQSKRDVIIDASIMGMGRGAGNLNVELLTEYLNEYKERPYITKRILCLIDEVINSFYEKKYWGYSLSNYLSAKHNIHPNYATYISEKNTLTYEMMDDIFSKINEDKRVAFDRRYIEELYVDYMSANKNDYYNYERLMEKFKDKEILIIAPGKTSIEEREKIIDYKTQKECITISVNFVYPMTEVDYIFVSNMRRFKEISNEKRNCCIVTSNIGIGKCAFSVDYKKLLSNIEYVEDNATIMLMKFLKGVSVKKILLAGVDGYSQNIRENYALETMESWKDNERFEKINMGMRNAIELMNNDIEIAFLTSRKYI